MRSYVQRSVQIQDSSQPSEARRIAQSMADQLEFNETKRGEAGIIVTEAARNIYTHGGGGEIVLCPWQTQAATGLDILALDKGPGMQDVGRCMLDGYSTVGTPGTGLGAISRLATVFDIYSVAGRGTAIFARVIAQENLSPPSLLTGAICIPLTGETACGDSWSEMHQPGRSVFIIADGLGHGKAASDASYEAIDVFHRMADMNPERMLLRMNDALRKTRGAAVAIAEVDLEHRVLRFAGVGNVVASVLTNDSSHSMVSHNGTVGHHFTRVQEFSQPWLPRSVLIMQSDGLTSRWDLRTYPGLIQKHPRLIAGVLYRDAKRGRDDATILVSRESEKS